MDANAVSTAQREKKGLLCPPLSSPSLALGRVIPVILQRTTGARHRMPLWSLLVCRAQTPQWTSKSGMKSGVESAAKEGKSSRCPGQGQGCPGGLCRAILRTAMTWGHTSVPCLPWVPWDKSWLNARGGRKQWGRIKEAPKRQPQHITLYMTGTPPPFWPSSLWYQLEWDVPFSWSDLPATPPGSAVGGEGLGSGRINKEAFHHPRWAPCQTLILTRQPSPRLSTAPSPTHASCLAWGRWS